MLSRSLRAVLRKESWMFCAGLLLSIADLLKFFELQNKPTCTLGYIAAGQAQNNSMFRGPSPAEHGGINLPPRRHISKAAPPSRVAASTIRCPPALFNPEVDRGQNILHSVKICEGIACASNSALVYNPRRG